MTLKDAEQRQLAIDPTASFIVQAPAGSGKTELLTQRFLRLLSTVSAPEQIVALTFTKKAAHEMRERILAALQKAASKTACDSSHQQQTLDYANAALQRDITLSWQILSEPGRLRIMTIDALCQRLAHAIPLQEHQLSFPQVSDKSERHYRNAAKSCLQFAITHAELHTPIQRLLRHVDNRQDTLINLFSDLLAKREQWLTPLFQAKMQEKVTMEAALAFIEYHELARLESSLPAELWQTLNTLSRQLAFIEDNPDSLRAQLASWSCEEKINPSMATSIAALLLTTQQTLRKSFDHHVGLKKGVCDDETYYTLKTHSQTLLATLENYPDFLNALIRVKELPEPTYPLEQWEVLQALFTLLPLLVAHLQLIFHQHNEVDFGAISQQALDALGEDDNPTDLALYLDHSIHHLLVDEFQDTSIQQFHLLSKIVQGWQIGDGRTLFVVGDPMQSIYRFRAAEVGLFLRAQREGIGSVKLTSLHLCCNFRSTQTIVEWINQHFRMIFPQTDDIESGAVCFHPSVYTQANKDETFIRALAYPTKEAEANAIVDIVQHELACDPKARIAILVRSRNQLSRILTQLRARQLPFQGIDIDLLAELPHLRDVWSLTQLLLQPANRLAWLAFLRSPWCGLGLDDLLWVANVDKKQSLYVTLSQLKDQNRLGLSEDGYIRCQFIIHVIKQALLKRHQQALVPWIIDTLTYLHSDQVLDAKAAADLEQFWQLLEQYEVDGQLADLNEFHQQLQQLYSKQVTPSRLQIMTIHKSKGLEFDCVILPGLSQKSSAIDKPLLRWLKLPSPEQDTLLLMSPMKAAHHERAPLYDYIGKLDAQKDEYERQRLLYVASTRAKKRLYLTDYQDKRIDGSFRDLLRMDFTMQDTDLYLSDLERQMPILCRLPIDTYRQPAAVSPETRAVASMRLTDTTPKRLGIVLHKILQWICTYHPQTVDDVPQAFIEHSLRAEMFIGPSFDDAFTTIKTQLQDLFQCSRGQWIIKPHEDERNEYELLILKNEDIATKIIDRTFCEQGIRWIIDFKTGQMYPEAHKKYRNQLNQYAQILSKKHSQPIRCGLYYLSQYTDKQPPSLDMTAGSTVDTSSLDLVNEQFRQYYWDEWVFNENEIDITLDRVT
jgi:ATP-dependent helicase/nuclease subunit A